MRDGRGGIDPHLKRAAVYARFSSDRQNDRSNADQIALCREWCARHGYMVVAVFQDSAISGASIHGRADMQRLLWQAKDRAFDLVVTDSLSRIGRDEEDRAAIRKRLTFHEIGIATPTEGVVTRLVDGIRAVMDGNYLEDLKHATRRGMAGRVREGKSAGGRAYGYRAVTGSTGALEIVPEEAAVVREIVRRYIDGEAPRAIARDLNRRCVPPPRGCRWNASTINGSRTRGNGILHNALYAGEIVWDKVRMMKDPESGKRISRPNPKTQWTRKAVPQLAILTPAEIASVAARARAVASTTPQRSRSAKRMLSGLLRCAGCGSGMAVYGRGKVGELRVRCSADRESGSCPAPGNFRLDIIEQTVVKALRAELQQPAVLTAVVAEYHAERQRLAGQTGKRRAAIERRLAEIQRAVRRGTDALLSGVGDPADIDARSKELQAERESLNAELATLTDCDVIVTLHPKVLADYAAKISRLEEAIANTNRAGDPAAACAIRDLIDHVIVRPGAKRGAVAVEIAGRLNVLLGSGFAPTAFPHELHSGELVVAGDRYSQFPRMGFLLRAR